MTEFRYNRVLMALIIVGLVAALAIVWQRHTLEKANSRVELAMDYEDVLELAQLEGIPPQLLLQDLKQAGLTSLAVYETTLEKLNKNGKATAMPGSHILHQYRTGTLSDPEWRGLVENGSINPDDIYVIGPSSPAFAEVESDLIRRFGADRVKTVLGGPRKALAVKANYEKAVKWNLGLPTDEMREVALQGFYLIIRPSNYTKVTAEDVNAVFDRLNGIRNVSSIMYVGEEALGWPDQLPLTAARMKEKQLTLDMIEHPLQLQFVKQEGLLPLAALNQYKAARVYVVPKDEQLKLKTDELIDRWSVTVPERNIRVALLRKFEKPEPGKTLLATNLKYVSGVKQAVEARGFTTGPAGVFPPYFPPAPLLALVIAGATAAGVLLLTLIWPFSRKIQYGLFGILAIGLILPVLAGGGTSARQAAALASATVFPVLAMTWQLDRWRAKPAGPVSLGHILLDGAVGLTTTVLMAMVGGMYVAAVLGDVRFLLEMEIFRGVKLTFIMPLVLIMLVYLTRFNLFEARPINGLSDLWQQLVRLLNMPVAVKTLLIMGGAAVVAWVFIGRSGHTAGVPVPAIELKLRAWLEQLMYARPREKEFMIGHPAFMLAVMALYQQWPRFLHFALVIAATIGQGSLVETFAHLRTPVFMSAVRGIDGLLVGLVLGVIAVIGVQVLRRLTFELERRTKAL